MVLDVCMPKDKRVDRQGMAKYTAMKKEEKKYDVVEKTRGPRVYVQKWIYTRKDRKKKKQDINIIAKLCSSNKERLILFL